jgi:hypothetical protein
VKETEKKRDTARRGTMMAMMAMMMVGESEETNHQGNGLTPSLIHLLYVLVRWHLGCISKKSIWRSAQAAG